MLTQNPPLASSAPSATAPEASATAAAASATPPVPSPSGAASLCEDTQSGSTGTRSVGTVSGQVKSGRILIGIEAAAGPSGTFALAYIDASGLRELPAGVADWTTAHATWETPTTVVFDSERAGDRHLFRADIGDGTVTQITSAFRVGEQNAAFLGDGRIVHDEYSCAEATDFGLHISPTDGSSDSDLTPAHPVNDPAYDSEATVSPDGHTIVFVRHVDENNGALFSIDAGGGAATRLMPDSAKVSYPRWSPDGKTILFNQDVPAGATDLWTIPAIGGTPTRVTQSDPGAIRWEADWSPDGTQIVFKYYENGWRYNELHLANADGSQESVLWTGDNSTAETPHWGP
jgi:dipeptidyl aminopeptidase/acylaminoacyl peptidase